MHLLTRALGRSIFWDVRSYATDYLVETSLDHTFEKDGRRRNLDAAEMGKALFQLLAAPFSGKAVLAG